MEVSINQLIERIFSEEPKNPNSIELSFIDQIELKDLFEFLLTFFTDGSKLLYGNQDGIVDITKWGDDEINKMKNYCQSIGFDVIIEMYNKNDQETYYIDFNKMNYKKLKVDSKTELNEFKLPLNFKNSDFICVIYFNYFKE
tara:strand:+ start:864 stop:1289 length:426 start_codon:yes stop_codon:yes gene_type:complete